jgi:hypothetical protein
MRLDADPFFLATEGYFDPGREIASHSAVVPNGDSVILEDKRFMMARWKEWLISQVTPLCGER